MYKCTITATKVAINVAALPQSFAILANGWTSVVIKSIVASIAELINSTAAIKPHIVIINNHSKPLILNTKPNIITTIVHKRIIIILCSYFKQYTNPSKA